MTTCKIKNGDLYGRNKRSLCQLPFLFQKYHRVFINFCDLVLGISSRPKKEFRFCSIYVYLIFLKEKTPRLCLGLQETKFFDIDLNWCEIQNSSVRKIDQIGYLNLKVQLMHLGYGQWKGQISILKIKSYMSMKTTSPKIPKFHRKLFLKIAYFLLIPLFY